MKKMKNWLTGSKKGQSLVEMALITPVLLIMFLGVIEVGWALRNFVVAQNSTREAARFAARGRYLDFSETDRNEIGYPYVIAHQLDSLAGQLPLDVSGLDPNGTIIVSHVLVDTGECGGGDDDDLILSPLTQGYGHFQAIYGLPNTSRIDYTALADEMRIENETFNCDLAARTDNQYVPSVNSSVVVETFYGHELLVGTPFLAPLLADENGKMWMYTKTIMRIASDARGQVASAGQGCEAYPIAVHTSTLAQMQPGDSTGDIFNGAGTGNFGWLGWAGSPSQTYLAEEFRNPRLAHNDYTNAMDPDDHFLNAGDWVWGTTGVVNSNDIRDLLQDLVDNHTTIRIPVWDVSSGTGSNLAYHIDRFVLVQLTAFSLPGKWIRATYVAEDPGACPNVPIQSPGETPTATPDPSAPTLTVIASDGFESGDWSGGSGWSGSWSPDGGGNANVVGIGSPAEGSYHLEIYKYPGWATRQVDMTGITDPTLSLWWKGDGIKSGEIASVQVYDGSWHTILTVTDPQDDNIYHQANIDLSLYNMVSDFQVKIEASVSKSFWVDDLEIEGYR